VRAGSIDRQPWPSAGSGSRLRLTVHGSPLTAHAHRSRSRLTAHGRRCRVREVALPL